MSLNGIPISEDQCIGDSLDYINSAFQTLDTNLATVSSDVLRKINKPLSATTGQFLGYDGSSWVAADAPAGGSGSGGGTVTSVGLSSDGLLVVENSPITTFGTMKVSIGSVPLNKLESSGAIGGQVLTFNGSTSTWVPSAAPSSAAPSSAAPSSASWTLVATVTAGPFNAVQSYGSQPTGFYEIIYTRGTVYFNANPPSGPAINVTTSWYAQNSDTTSTNITETIKWFPSRPFQFKHMGLNPITVQLWDSNYPDNSGPGIELQLWRKANADIYKPFGY